MKLRSGPGSRESLPPREPNRVAGTQKELLADETGTYYELWNAQA